MRVTLIHNPGAGRTDHRGKDELVALLEAQRPRRRGLFR